MSDDDLRLLSEFRNTVPTPDSATARRVYERVTTTQPLRSRLSRRKVVLGTAAAAAVIAGSAVAAVTLLGQPAPKGVQADIHRSAVVMFSGHPGLVKATARVVAEASDATLYGISDRQGNYCVELIGARKGLVWSFICEDGLRIGSHFVTPGAEGLDIEAITVKGVEPPVIRWGRLATGTTKAVAVYPDGTTEQIPIGSNGFFVYEPSTQNQRLARQEPMTIQFQHDDGTPVLSTEVLPPQPVATTGPGFQSTISGHVLIRGAANVAVYKYSLGHATHLIPINADGTFTWTRPKPKPAGGSEGVLQVVDKDGKPLSDYLDAPSPLFWKKLLAQARHSP